VPVVLAGLEGDGSPSEILISWKEQTTKPGLRETQPGSSGCARKRLSPGGNA
jgi:hypothetical protein